MAIDAESQPANTVSKSDGFLALSQLVTALFSHFPRNVQKARKAMGDTTDFYRNLDDKPANPPAVFQQTMHFERADRYNYKYIAADFGMPLYGIAINKVALLNDPPNTIVVTVHRGE